MKIRKKFNLIIKFDDKPYTEEEKAKIMYDYFALLANWRAKKIFNKKSITQCYITFALKKKNSVFDIFLL